MANGTKMQTGGKGKCPMSSVKDSNGNFMRKVRISDNRCADPTKPNQRKAFQYKQKQDQMAINKKRGPEATRKAGDAFIKKAKASGRGIM